MNFQQLGKIEQWDKYVDMAFHNGAERAMQVRDEVRGQDRQKIQKSKHIEIQRIISVGKSFINNMEAIGRGFPSIDSLPPFYQELVRCTLEYDQLKVSLGAVNWAKKQHQTLLDKYTNELKRAASIERLNILRRQYYGRANSVMKQIKDNLAYLEESRKIMKGYPALKTSMDTVVISGMPNVGKSTLLAALTGSKPTIAPYPFTTTNINLGSDKEKNIQYVDTPGLLDRPLAKRNPIERQAILALKHLAKLIIFVIDPTESCGYSIPEQRNLLVEIKKAFEIPVIVVSNKSDTGKEFPNSIPISAKEKKGIPELKKQINDALSHSNKQEQRQQ